MTIDLEKIKKLQEKPEPFTPGEELFWDDPYISQQMLSAHLNPNTDAASRKPETILKSVNWISDTTSLQKGSQLLDLGCGPGLYAEKFAALGVQVTGIDYSQRSISYAKERAAAANLPITYHYQNYLNISYQNSFDVVLLIYGDYCPLNPEQRKQLLSNVQCALKPGGYFVLDVTTPRHRKKWGSKNGWYAMQNGFWKPGNHLVLEEGFDYPEESIFLDQAVVIDEADQIFVYRNWFQDFNKETITRELENGGFIVRSVWGDLTGQPFSEDGDWIGVVAQKN